MYAPLIFCFDIYKFIRTEILRNQVLDKLYKGEHLCKDLLLCGWRVSKIKAR